MKKFEVNNKPTFFSIIFTVLTALWTITFLIGCSVIAVLVSEKVAFISGGILVVILVIGCYIADRPTTVEYGAEKVHWKWLWHDYTVNFSDVDSVRYTIIHEHTRYGYNHRFEIVFRLKNGTTLRLNDSLKLEDIDNSIYGTTDNIKLMQLYKFIENIYPEKSHRFTKTSNETL
ncbi:MAG: hypothetical protein K2J40_08435 [Ruminococcus sp.]|nr:hypothetical protein [Ruminococcus sp.]